MKKNPHGSSKMNININKDHNELNDFLICWNIFGKRPNKISIQNTYLTSAFTNLVDDLLIEKNVSTEIVATKEGKLVFNQELFCKIEDDIYISYYILDKNQSHSVISDVMFFYKDEENYEKVKEIIELMNSCLPGFDEEEHYNLNHITIFNSVMEVEPITFDDEFDNFDYYYSEVTLKEINKSIKKLKKNDKGLYIFNGERGTGKTFCVKYLASNVDKMFFYIPNNLLESTINNPEFKNLLKKYQSPVLIIDDCESSLQDIFSKNNQTSSNIIQMVDGILSDNLPVSVICIFNDFIEEDNILLDCNNLQVIVDFEYLSEEESTELSKLVGNNKSIKNKSKMLDIIRKKNPSKDKKIGF